MLRWQLACGVQHVRSHVDVCDPELRALRALVELREEARGVVDLQLVAFPQQGIRSFDGGAALMRKAVELGADVVGAIPHYELTREDGVESVRFAMALADEHGLRVDIHCDETDDDHSRFLETMVAETIRRGMGGRVTASHTTAMHSYNAAYASRLIANISRAGLHMVTNPLDNAVLQGRFDAGPIRRGHTRVKELLAAGVNVAIGHDSVMDPWYPLGFGDPLQAAFVLAHLGHMSGDAELRTLLDMITVAPAAALGVADYGIRPGGPADLVVFDARSEAEALRLQRPRHLVLRAGRIVVVRPRPRSVVSWHGTETEVDFRPQNGSRADDADCWTGSGSAARLARRGPARRPARRTAPHRVRPGQRRDGHPDRLDPGSAVRVRRRPGPPAAGLDPTRRSEDGLRDGDEACLVGAVVHAAGGPEVATGQLAQRALDLIWHALYRGRPAGWAAGRHPACGPPGWRTWLGGTTAATAPAPRCWRCCRRAGRWPTRRRAGCVRPPRRPLRCPCRAETGTGSRTTPRRARSRPRR